MDGLMGGYMDYSLNIFLLSNPITRKSYTNPLTWSGQVYGLSVCCIDEHFH